MNDLIEEAVRVVVGMEGKSHALYRRASLLMPEGEGKRVLERMAGEQAVLIEEISAAYPYQVADPTGRAGEIAESGGDLYPAESPERRLFNNLRMALLDKHHCLESYAAYLESFREPAVRQVFELAFRRTREIFAMIAEAYRQADMRLHRPGGNRRAKRMHIKPVEHCIPNKHSQLYISLLDSGRRFPV